MGERPYCPRHERYIYDGACVDCTREVEEAKEEGRQDAVRRIAAWMRAERTPHAQADAIERGDWRRFL